MNRMIQIFLLYVKVEAHATTTKIVSFLCFALCSGFRVFYLLNSSSSSSNRSIWNILFDSRQSSLIIFISAQIKHQKKKSRVKFFKWMNELEWNDGRKKWAVIFNIYRMLNRRESAFRLENPFGARPSAVSFIFSFRTILLFDPLPRCTTLVHSCLDRFEVTIHLFLCSVLL